MQPPLSHIQQSYPRVLSDASPPHDLTVTASGARRDGLVDNISVVAETKLVRTVADDGTVGAAAGTARATGGVTTTRGAARAAA